MERDIRKRSFQFAVEIVRYVDGIKSKGIHWSIYDQLLRSGTSIGANVHEAQGASSRKDFKRYYEISLKSCNETMFWLFLIRDALGETSDPFRDLERESIEISKMLAACILTLKSKP